MSTSLLTQGYVFWLTGLSGAGKSSIAQGTAESLRNLGYPVVILDGDIIRAGLCKDLGFSAQDRTENNRRCAEVAKLLACEAKIICIAAFISPLESMRQKVCEIIGDAVRIIYIDCDLTTCIARDPKGNYSKVQQGLLKGYTGIAAPYEAPKDPAFTIQTAKESLEESIQKFVNYIQTTITPAHTEA